MKVELVKRQDRYDLYGVDGAKIASSAPNPFGKLSKENCNEIFGVVDVDDLAYKHRRVYQDSFEWMNECIMKDAMHQQIGFVAGFNKAMELNKDKLFTATNLRVGMISLLYLEKEKHEFSEAFKERQFKFVDDYVQSLQQPTEIEVEIVSELAYTVNENSETEMMPEPHIKLDENGCIVLRKL